MTCSPCGPDWLACETFCRIRRTRRLRRCPCLGGRTAKRWRRHTVRIWKDGGSGKLLNREGMVSSQKTQTSRLIFGNLNFWQLWRSNLRRAGVRLGRGAGGWLRSVSGAFHTQRVPRATKAAQAIGRVQSRGPAIVPVLSKWSTEKKTTAGIGLESGDTIPILANWAHFQCRRAAQLDWKA